MKELIIASIFLGGCTSTDIKTLPVPPVHQVLNPLVCVSNPIMVDNKGTWIYLAVFASNHNDRYAVDGCYVRYLDKDLTRIKTAYGKVKNNVCSLGIQEYTIYMIFYAGARNAFYSFENSDATISQHSTTCVDNLLPKI